MSAREEYLKRINKTIASWKAEIELRGNINFYDIHIIAEYHVAKLMNMAFGYQFENLNEQTRNKVAIDLGDRKNKVAMQVTSTKKRSRIKETIDKFIKYELYKQFTELFFFILSTKQDKYKGFDTQGLFSFETNKHIIDFRDLIARINTLDTARLLEIVEFLDREFTISDQADTYDLQIALKYFPETWLGTSFLVQLTNHGQRPITLTNVILNLKSGGQISYSELSRRYIQLSAPLPHTLKETEFSEYLFPLYHMNEIKGDEVTSPLDVISVEILDSFERSHQYPSGSSRSLDDFSLLRKHIQDDWRENDWLSNRAN